MSRTVDERVVSLQLDNKNLESNAKTSMSTLDKLKDKLNFKGAEKGANSLSNAVKKVDVSPIGRGVEAVHAKFSALEVMGVTALANITNSAVNAGKRIVSALTIDPIKTGFQEYETQINSVQTILANTESKGSTLDDVNAALEELNKYADQTIYNFTEMTRNIGTFTAAGVDLETSTNAIKGIANLAAVSGSTSQQASTAMYQLSQALASGTVKLMDWNSVVNAGMGGQVFQDALKETARVHGVAIDSMIKEQGSFRETLSEGWLTSEILTDTLQKFTLATEGLTEEQIAANREMLKAKGYTDDQIDGIFKLGNTATNAATKVKTFTQLWDVMKESAQSGWAQTWKLIIGDFEEAKNLLTPLSDFFVKMIGGISKARNDLLESALGKGFTKTIKGLSDVLNKAKTGMDGVLKPVKNVAGALEDLGVIVDKVIIGNFGNGQKRFDALTEAGQNYYRVQNKVNETLGNTFRYSDKQIEAQDKLLKSSKKSTEGTKDQSEAVTELTKEDKELLKTLSAMSDAQLKSKGYSDAQIKAIRDLAKQAEKLGIPLNEFIDNLDKINGRWLLLDGFKTVGQSLVKIFGAMGDAWREIFPPMTADRLFNIIGSFHKFTSYLKVNEDAAEKFRRTFKGVFAVLDLVIKLVATPLKIAFKVLTQVLSYFDLNILDVTAAIGDALVWFNNWIESTLDVTKILDRLVPSIKNIVKAVGDWIDGLKETDNIPKYIIDGLVNGLMTGIKTVGGVIWDLGVNLLNTLKKVLGIHSPSKETEKIGVNIIEGLVKGISEFVGIVWETIKSVGQGIINIFKNINIGEAIAALVAGGIVVTLVKVGSALNNISKPFAEFGDVLDAFQGALKSFSLNLKAKALKSIAIAIAILAASVIALSFVDYGKLWSAVGAIVVLGIVLGGLAVVLDKVLMKGLKPKDAAKFGQIALMLLAISASILLMAIALRKIASIKPESFGQAIEGIVVVIGSMLAALILISALNKYGGNIDKAGETFFKMAAAMLVMGIVVKIMGGISDKKLKQGLKAILAFGGIIVGLMAATKLLGGNDKSIDKIGKSISKIATAMLLMAAVALITGNMNPKKLKQGIIAITAFGAIIVGLMAATKLISGSKNVEKIGSAIMGVGTALLLMAFTAMLLSGISVGNLVKGTIAIAAFGAIIVGLMWATKLVNGSKNVGEIGKTLLLTSVAITLLAGVAVLLGLVSIPNLVKGVVAVTALAGIMAGLMFVSKYTKGSSMGSIIAMTVAIGLLATALIALSFIDPIKLLSASVALGGVMAVFALLLKSAGSAKKAHATILIMTIAVAALGGILYLLGQLKPENAIASAVSLSLLMVAMAFVLKQLGSIKTTIIEALASAISLTLLAIPLAVFALTLGLMSGVQNAIVNAVALSVLMLAMTGVLAALSAIGVSAALATIGASVLLLLAVPMLAFVGVLAVMSLIKDATTNALTLIALVTVFTLLLPILALVGALWIPAAIGLIALTAMVVPMLFFIGAIALMSLIEDATANANLLIGMMTTMTMLLIILAPVAPMAVIAAAAIGALGLVMVEIAALAVTVGGIMELCPILKDFLDVGIPILEQLANAVGSIMGNLISGFMTAVTDGLPEVGVKLSEFATNLQPFITVMSQINPNMMESIKTLVGAITALTAASLMDGITSFLTGGSDLGEFGKKIAPMGTHMRQFVDNLGEFGDDQITTVTCACKAIATLSKAAGELPNDGGLAGFFAGENSIDVFGNKLPGLATNLVGFITNLGTFDDATVATVECAGNAIKKLADAASKIPNDGGLAGFFAGENSIDVFGDKLPGLATNIVSFVTNLGTFGEDQIATAKAAADVVVKLAEAGGKIPNDGGLAGFFAGENSIDKFGDKLPGLATNITGFIENLGTFGEDQVTAAKCAGNTIAALAKAAGNIPNEGGLVSLFTGDNDISKWGKKLPGLGTNVKNFAKNLGTLGEDKVASVNAAAKIVDAAAKMGKKGNDPKKIETMGKNLKTLGTKVKEFATTVSGVGKDNLDTAVANLNAIIKAVNKITKKNAESAKTFGESLKTLGQTGVEKFVEAMSGAQAIKDVEGAADKMIKAFTKKAEGKIEGDGGINATANKIAEAFSNKLKSEDNITKANTAGKNVVEGFVAGINNNKSLATDAGSALGKAALEAAKAALDEHSPSREFYKVGDYAGKGLVNALYDYIAITDRAGGDLGRSAIDGLKTSISRIGDFVANDIDSQPTIRPVLDLSDVQAGANRIGGMFGSHMLSVNANNAGVVSSMMFGYQNGRNSDELATQIKGLRKDLNSTPRNTYSVNGVTVEEGSSAATAIRSLVDALQVEGRA